MIIIANKRVPENKKLVVALTYVFGIGDGIAKKITKEVNVENKKVIELTFDEANSVVKEAEKYLIEDKLREKIYKDKAEKIGLGTYQGRRLECGLPVHGQSTRHNSRTAKKSRKSSSKKAFFGTKTKNKKASNISKGSKTKKK